MRVRFPFEIDHVGHVAQPANDHEHVVELIEQVLFTNPGERVNRPNFGCGTLLLVFESCSPQVAIATTTLVHAELQRWLSELILVDSVRAEATNSELLIVVQYVDLNENVKHIAEYRRVL